MTDDHCTKESDWTQEGICKLFSQMKDNIPCKILTCSYSRGLKHVDWDKVAFPPFSAKACQQKWKQHLDKMRKVRSLSELIAEAEDVLSNPWVNPESHPQFPKRPPCPPAMYCADQWTKLKERHPELAKNTCSLEIMNKRYSNLSEKQKDEYSQKYKRAYQEYREKRTEFRQKVKLRLSAKPKRRKADTATVTIDGLPPRPPANGYILFCKEHPVTTCVSGGDNVKNWAQGWRDLTKTEKKTHNDRVNKMKEEYTAKLMERLATLPEKDKKMVLQSHAMFVSKKFVIRKTFKEPEMPPDLPEDKRALGKRPDLRKYSINLQNWFRTLTKEEKAEYRKSNPSKCIYLGLPQTKGVSDDDTPDSKTDDNEDDEDSSSSEEKEEDYPDWNEEMDEEEEDDGDNTFDLH